jgi:hypothetical protein
MGAQGWHGDPFSLHEDRWFSAGQPTRLVRDQGVESYDEPPPSELPLPPDLSDDAGPGQLADARFSSSGIVVSRPITRMAAANRKPARNWRYWTVWPPCLLTLASAVLATIGLISSVRNGSGPGQEGVGSYPGGAENPVGWTLVVEAGLIVAAVAAIVVLYAAADKQVSRRACALAGWVIAALEYGWAVGIAFLSTLVR